MATWNLGSPGSVTLQLISGVPENISGALLGIAERKVAFIEEKTGATLGSTGIALKYQDVLLNLTIADTLRAMHLQGVDATEVKLGDFTVKHGAGGNLDVAGQKYRNVAMEELKTLGSKLRAYQTFYG